jgi:SH3-like domain-containing protein
MLSALIALSGAGALHAGEFRSIGDTAAVLYDAPSSKANKRYVLTQGYPVEVVVIVEGWTKVRDAKGELTWIESKHLADKRFLLVTVPMAQIRESAGDGAPVAFEAEENVLLELLEVTRGGWLRVRHRDGQEGFVKVTQVWGA